MLGKISIQATVCQYLSTCALAHLHRDCSACKQLVQEACAVRPAAMSESICMSWHVHDQVPAGSASALADQSTDFQT